MMKAKFSSKELVFQVVINALVFLFYAYDRRGDSFMNYHFVFFLNYAVAALIINYIALPLYYRHKSILVFSLIVLGSLLLSVFTEELLLEKIFFPDRGDSFKAWWAFLEIVPVVMILSGAKFAWDAIVKQREVDLLKSAVKQSELQFLKSQINPHFLFNNLNNLYAYALEGSKQTPDMILELSGLLRYMLYECKDEYVLLSKEVDQMEQFISLNERQIEDRGVVNVHKEGDFNGYKIAPLVLVVFIENAFKHSLASQSENIEIKINLKISKEGRLVFQCENSFGEMTNNEALSNGIGLQNVIKRLDLIYADHYELDISQVENRYIVHLQMDLSK